MQINTNIQFTQDEQEIINIIKDVIKKYTPSTRAFIVGGWVRDHLLGIPSNDIDIMIDNMSGEDFAKLVTQYINAKDAHAIRANPEKSKFLATAKSFIPLSSGAIQEVDFAQARTDVYDEKSRIPIIKSATPQEDAFRRDFTINSIFYDILNNKVVDFTGMGLEDLKNKVIRTPLDPIKTFNDDPLRAIRAARFVSKLGWGINENTLKAMSNPLIREKIKNKLSRERIGEEFKKMLSDKYPEKGLIILKQTGFLSDIIEDALKNTKYNGNMMALDMDQNNPHHKLSLWEHTLHTIKNITEKYKNEDVEKRVVMILSALLHDFGKLYVGAQQKKQDELTGKEKTTYHGHEEESSEITKYILQYLKMDPYVKQTSELVKYHMNPHNFIDNKKGRTLRRFIREMGEKGLNWMDVLNLSTADAYSKDINVDQKTIDDYDSIKDSLQKALSETGSEITNKPVTIKPILDGNEIMTIFNNKPGPWVKDVVNFIKELQDETPHISKEEATKEIKNKFPQYIIQESLCNINWYKKAMIKEMF